MRRILPRLATVASALILVGLAAAGVLASPGNPAEQDDVAPRRVDVPATTVRHVCPGPPRLATEAAGDDLGYDEFDPVGSGTDTALDVVSLARREQPPAPAMLAEEPSEETEGTELDTTRELGHHHGEDLGKPAVLQAEPIEGISALVAGSTTSLTQDGDLRGLVATSCLRPGTSSWLVGGTTDTGQSAQLVLMNPGSTPASVEVSAWGAAGELDTSSIGTVLVAPGSEQVVLLEAGVPDEERLVVHAQAEGGQVAAYLQDSQLHGLVPGGTDIVAPGAEPATSQVMPGFHVAEDDNSEPLLRVLNPNEETTSASMTLLGTEGSREVPGAQDLELEAGAVLDVPLSGLPEGWWSLDVEAAEPVVAGTMLSHSGEQSAGEAPVDRAWAPAVPASDHDIYAIPQQRADQSRLMLANPGQQPITATVVATTTAGERLTTEVTVPPQAIDARSVAEFADDDGEQVAALEVMTADDTAEFHSAVTVTDDTLVSVIAPTGDPHASRAVPLGWRPAGLG